MQLQNQSFRMGQVCAVAGVSANTLNAWINREQLKIDNPNQFGWRRFSFMDLLRVCAWAEVKGAGISPVDAPQVVYEVEGALERFALEGVPERCERDGFFVLAEVLAPVEMDGTTQHIVNVRLANWSRVCEALRTPSAERLLDSATVVLVNPVKLFKRIEKTLASALFANLPSDEA